MATYTYTIFDADPQSSSGTEWPSHQDIEIEADSDADAIDEVESVMSVEAAGLNPSDGYEAGNSIHAIVWTDDGAIVGQPSYELTHEDLGTQEEPSDDELIELASDHIDANKQEDGDYAYECSDEGHARRYIVSESDMVDLGRMIHEDMGDAYSHWCAQTAAHSFRVVDLDDDRLTYLTPPRNQGQIVEVSYADTGDGRVIRKIYDKSDRSTAYAIADLSDEDMQQGAGPSGLNDEPSIEGDWDPCVLAD